MTDDTTIIARCTRNGVVLWQHVAAQLGVSVDKARSQYDPAYRTARQDPQQLSEPDPASMPDAIVYRSPHPKGDGLKAILLVSMEKHGRLSTSELSSMSCSTPDSVRRRLNDLVAAKLVQHDGDTPRTWCLTEAGHTIARTYFDRPGRVGRGTELAGKVAA